MKIKRLIIGLCFLILCGFFTWDNVRREAWNWHYWIVPAILLGIGVVEIFVAEHKVDRC